MISPINDKCEAFDAAFGIWYWLSHWHGGMSCPKYAAMSFSHDYNMSNIPCIDFDNDVEYGHEDFDEENEGAIMRYHELNENNWEQAVNEFRNFMDNEWDLED